MRFKDKDLGAFWEGASLPRRVPPDCRKAPFGRLQVLEAARDLADLRMPPSNLLEELSGTRAGRYGIRVTSNGDSVSHAREARHWRVEPCDCH